jgi:hypothetical protein
VVRGMALARRKQKGGRTMVHAGGTFHPARSRKLPSLVYPNCTQGQAHFGVEAWLLGR